MEVFAPDIEMEVAAEIRMQAPGSCGEFVQGYIDGQDFLVNCPIDLYACAKVSRLSKPGLSLHLPEQFNKIRDIATLIAEEFFLELKHHIVVESAIPRGKGMASSTADITAALAALCRSCDLPLSDKVFSRLITEIEPSDCLHFPGIAHVNHLTGDLIELLPAPQDMKVLVLDCGGEIDTIGFDRQRARHVYHNNAGAISDALALLKRGLHMGNLQWVADAATHSAELSQKIHFKPQFDALRAIAKEAGALGINCAHSGSVLGVLFRSSEILKENLLRRITPELGSSVNILGEFRIIGGGYHEF